MKFVHCLECGNPMVRIRRDAQKVWHRSKMGRKWCITSPGYQPPDPIKKASYLVAQESA